MNCRSIIAWYPWIIQIQMNDFFIFMNKEVCWWAHLGVKTAMGASGPFSALRWPGLCEDFLTLDYLSMFEYRSWNSLVSTCLQFPNKHQIGIFSLISLSSYFSCFFKIRYGCWTCSSQIIVWICLISYNLLLLLFNILTVSPLYTRCCYPINC